MSRAVSRRLAASVAAAAVVAGGTVFGVGAGAGVASAAECGTSATKVQYGDAQIVGIQLTKVVVGDGTVAPGGTVTYKTTVSRAKGVPPLLRSVADFYPAGFTLVSAKLNGKPVTASVDTNVGKASYQGGGWLINAGNTVTYETTYTVPEDAQVGAVLDSGASMTPDLWGEQKWNPIGVCVTVRGKNAGETVSGSLDGAGLGSSGPIAGGSAGSAILNDPAGFIADIIGNVLSNGS
ncbi:hypothetical protein [Rhodococcus sp. SGAir0479]|uniref:hypothetical protein n=1 Tax=Rhodococcus sp. SGAir0479 TaxID=2567884 RepID=UPI0010CD2DC7|nr:hypothetical protein [Rhodococcus sp. SGAir0479]QCQ89812.1 hypothetical protein E7742_00355 [Rhodococcus sp. SGAir0479]